MFELKQNENFFLCNTKSSNAAKRNKDLAPAVMFRA